MFRRQSKYCEGADIYQVAQRCEQNASNLTANYVGETHEKERELLTAKFKGEQVRLQRTSEKIKNETEGTDNESKVGFK